MKGALLDPGAGSSRDAPRSGPPVPAGRGATLAVVPSVAAGDLGMLFGLAARAADQAAPVGSAEDEDQCEGSENDRPGGDRDLLAHRIGEYRDRTRPDQCRDQQCLL